MSGKKRQIPRRKHSAGKSLVAKVRLDLSRSLIERMVQRFEMAEVFFKSQSWTGYNRACNSWHSAFWKWVDSKTPPNIKTLMRSCEAKWSSLARGIVPPANDERKALVTETIRQEYLRDRALFLHLWMLGPEAEQPETYKMYVDLLRQAGAIGDDEVLSALAKQKQRKPTKDEGDRRLKYQILLCWIPACLWAFKCEGIAQFLNQQYPRSGSAPYDRTTISHVRRQLKLFHPKKPLWSGMKGSPPQLDPP